MKGFIWAAVVLTLLICALVFTEVFAYTKLCEVERVLSEGENKNESAQKALSVFDKYENMFLLCMNTEFVYNAKTALCGAAANTDEPTCNGYVAESHARLARMKRALFV